ncbi:hypothetical protein Pmar_PMAR009469 [Perkinsus marinus ATCC 50983]|uniref:Uncharacterized protein n=1 Tax=Perkinsus marinus (strain ATCC 50983 / TXsc) TaxID=423536 RepID=C5K9Z2_PERM5|nr:hypothetical protein Pmar_PMAR009469 [Perkinsus marinus ATCC 50983]EER18701.1 hypothetical protein Pmar_PMAR009469 [Perkinsus marinus ATCC 50983]|eukprot:XP_002786905.1 hypothetical protein Pmar_PMAR009469 [Perkinsus marinus ATCC 50983]
MPPPIYKVMGTIARPTLGVIGGAAFGCVFTFGCVRSVTKHVNESSLSSGILTKLLTSRLCSSLTTIAGGWAAAITAYKYIENDDASETPTMSRVSAGALTDQSPTYETVVHSRPCPPLLTSTYLAFHISHRKARN